MRQVLSKSRSVRSPRSVRSRRICRLAGLGAMVKLDPMTRRTATKLRSSPRAFPVLPTTYGIPWDTKNPMFPLPGSPRRGLEPTVHTARAWVPEKGRRLPPLETPMAFGEQTDSRRRTTGSTVFGGGHSRFGALEDSRGHMPIYVPSPLAYSTVGACGTQPLSSRPTYMMVGLNTLEPRWAPQERWIKRVATPGPVYYRPAA